MLMIGEKLNLGNQVGNTKLNHKKYEKKFKKG